MRPVRHRLLDLLVWCLPRLPLGLSSGLCWCLAFAWWWVLPARRAVGVDNLARALPDLPARRHGPTLRQTVHDVLLGYVEVLQLAEPALRGAVQVRVEGAEAMLARTRAGLPCLLVGTHLGSWDVALLSMGLVPDLRVTCVVRPPSDPWVARLIERCRRSVGVGLLPPSGCRDRIDALLQGGNTVLLPIDQRQASGMEVAFFGRPALTGPSLVAFARRTGVPVWFLSQWREGPGRHVLRFNGPLPLEWTGDREADLRQGLEAIHRMLEAEIRARPHGWWWLHRRWGGTAPRGGGAGRATGDGV